MNTEIKLPETELEMQSLLERIAEHLEKNDWCHLMNWDHEIDELENKVSDLEAEISDRENTINQYKGAVTRFNEMLKTIGL